MKELINKIKKSLGFRFYQIFLDFSYKYIDLKWNLQSGLVINIKNHAEWVIYNDIFVDCEYDIPIQKVLNSSGEKHKLIVLDLGANVGFFTLRLADLLIKHNSLSDFQITLVEGSPSVCNELITRIKSQKMIVEHLNIVNGLVGELQGEAKIIEQDFHVMNTVSFDNNEPNGRYVKFIDLNSLFPENVEIDLIKCDIEGSELIFLENYQNLLRRVKSAVFELHHNKCDTARCREILKNAGFLNHQNIRTESEFSVDFFWK
jgi:FkbM family methyltransferase